MKHHLSGAIDPVVWLKYSDDISNLDRRIPSALCFPLNSMIFVLLTQKFRIDVRKSHFSTAVYFYEALLRRNADPRHTVF